MTGRFVNPLTAKLLTIGLLALVLLFPLAQVRSLVHERQAMRQSAVDRIGVGWGARQIIGSPILAVPIETDTRLGERIVRTPGVVHVLAGQASLQARLRPELRHLGIYTVPVYVAAVQVSGEFDAQAIGELLAMSADNGSVGAASVGREPTGREQTAGERTGRIVHWSRARIVVPVADVRGIREVKLARWDGKDLHLQPAAYDDLGGIGAQIDASPLTQGRPIPFRFEMELAGSEALHVLPLARATAVQIASTWQHPNFSAGAFLPARYTLDSGGFDAHWQVLELNRDFPQSWPETAVAAARLRAAAFGVDLYQPVDTYQRNERAIKYALLFIAITLMSIFLWEHLSRTRLHALQYLLVGLALCVFYLLLLALSEHVSFAGAYLIAATALVALVGVYLAGALRSRRAGALAGIAMASVYALLYLLVLSEQYALLLGAVLLFGVLATIMLVTRRLNWHALAAGGADPPPGD